MPVSQYSGLKHPNSDSNDPQSKEFFQRSLNISESKIIFLQICPLPVETKLTNSIVSKANPN